MWDKFTLKLKMITRSDIESYNTTSGESPNLTLFCDMHKFLRCQLYEWKIFGLEGIYIKQMIFNLLSCLTQTYPTINTYEIWFCGCVIAKKRLVTFVICNCTKLPRMSDISMQYGTFLITVWDTSLYRMGIYICIMWLSLQYGTYISMGHVSLYSMERHIYLFSMGYIYSVWDIYLYSMGHLSIVWGIYVSSMGHLPTNWHSMWHLSLH